MTPRSVRRAAERKEKRAISQTEANQNIHGATSPIPVPDEPAPVPVIPAPDVEPLELEPDPDTPQPATSRYEEFIVAGESCEEFAAFAETLDDHYMPFNLEERVFVGLLAECRWFLRRRKRVFESVESELYAAQPDPAKWSEDDFKRLALADSYRVQAEVAVVRAQRRVEAFLQQRINDYHFATSHDLAVRRLELQKRKFELAVHNAATRAKHAAASGGVEPAPSTKKAVAS